MNLADRRQLIKDMIAVIFHMADEIPLADILSDKHAVLILTSMSYMKERPKMSDFDTVITNFHLLNSAIKHLTDAGLIITETMTKPRKTTYLEYTEKGKMISYLLQQINEICLDDHKTPKLSSLELTIK